MKPNEQNGQTQPLKQRHIRDGCAWCWQSKKMLRTINDVFDATNNIVSARSVYLALTEMASDNQSETFTTPISDIARRAGVSYKTAARILARFEALRIIHVQRNFIAGTQELAPSTYTLAHDECLTLGNHKHQASLPRVQKNAKKQL